MGLGEIVQLFLAVGLLGVGVMLALVGALVTGLICGGVGAVWFVWTMRRL